jgi:putative redox protein
VVTHFRDQVPAIEIEGRAVVNLAGRPFTLRREFLADVAAQDQKSRIAALGRPLLILHSPVDTVVGIDNAQAIFQAAHHPKSFVSLDDSDHLLSRAADAEYAAGVIAGWAARYLPEPASVPAPVPPGTVVVEETRRSKFEQSVTAGKQHFLADEPAAAGGGDAGPGPYDLLLAGLGACTAMTLRLYADFKKLPLDRVRVTLRHSRDYAEDCKDCEAAEAKLERIDRGIVLEGDLDATMRARLMAIADKCPVHRTLTSKVDIRTVEIPA